MQISKSMSGALNAQITHEFSAAHSYLAMACMFDNLGLRALAGHFRRQADEERSHALKLLDYVLEVGAVVELTALAAPKSDYASVRAAIDAALKHEKKVTEQIHGLVTLAEKEKDYATRSFLQWFVDEQVEEISSMEHLVRIAELAGNNLLQLESYLRHMNAPKS